MFDKVKGKSFVAPMRSSCKTKNTSLAPSRFERISSVT